MAPTASVGPTRLHLVEVSPAAVGEQWLDLDHLVLVDQPNGVAAAIWRGVAEFRGQQERPPGRPDWFRQGWRVEADAWIDETLAAAGLVRRGPSETVTAWALSLVLRVPVDTGDAVYFKATCDWFRAEPVITALLARWASDVVPSVIATDASRAWMLMRPLPGDDADTPTVAGPAAATALARLQQSALEHPEAVRAAGVPDRRLTLTIEGIAAVVERSDMAPAERQRMRQLLPWLAEEMAALAGCGMPYSIAHGDLHLGNVAYADGRVVLYDWTDTALTFPALDLEILSESAREHSAETREAYVAAWRDFVGEAAVTEAFRHTGPVNLAYQAISYDGIARSVEPGSSPENAAITVRVLRRLNQLYAERAG